MIPDHVENPATEQQILEAHADAVATAGRLLGRQDAEDVAQEALLQALAAARRGAVIENPRAYLRAIVRNVAADRLRARNQELPMAELPERASTAGDPLLAAQLGEISVALERLSPKQRQAVLATAFVDAPQRALAARLGTTPAGLRQLVRRARIGLRDSLGAWLPGLAVRLGDLTALVSPSGASAGAVAAVTIAIAMPPAPTPPPTPPQPPTPVAPAVQAIPAPG